MLKPDTPPKLPKSALEFFQYCGRRGAEKAREHYANRPRRQLVIQAFAEGSTLKDVADRFGVPYNTAWVWRKRYAAFIEAARQQKTANGTMPVHTDLSEKSSGEAA